MCEDSFGAVCRLCVTLSPFQTNSDPEVLDAPLDRHSPPALTYAGLPFSSLCIHRSISLRRRAPNSDEKLAIFPRASPKNGDTLPRKDVLCLPSRGSLHLRETTARRLSLALAHSFPRPTHTANLPPIICCDVCFSAAKPTLPAPPLSRRQ